MRHRHLGERSILFSLFLFALASNPARADWPGDLVEQYKDAIVYIDAVFKEVKEGERPRHEYGIGFVILPSGYVLTANHVALPSPDNPGEQFLLATGSLRTPSNTALELDLVQTNDNDVALFRLPDVQKSFAYVPLDLPMSQYSPNAKIATLSIPPGLKEVRALPGTLSGTRLAKGTNWATDLQFVAGESGCPVFNTAGKVVGLCEAGTEGNASLTYVKPIYFARDLVDTAVHFSAVANVAAAGFEQSAIEKLNVDLKQDITAPAPKFVACASKENGVKSVTQRQIVEGFPNQPGGGVPWPLENARSKLVAALTQDGHTDIQITGATYLPNLEQPHRSHGGFPPGPYVYNRYWRFDVTYDPEFIVAENPACGTAAG